MARFGFVAVAALMVAGTAQAASLTPAEIVARHNAAVAGSNVEAMLADYAEDAVVLQDGKALQGKPAIRALFTRMFPKPAPGAPPSGAAAMTVTRKWAEGDVGFYSWQMGAVSGTDEFLVRDGKIKVQTVFMKSAPPTQ